MFTGIGTLYDIHGQEIPLMFPLDQEAMVRAVQTDSKISQGLYERLGEDIKTLKRKVSSEISDLMKRGKIKAVGLVDYLKLIKFT